MIDFFLDPIIFVGFLVGLGISLSFIFQKVGIPHVVVYIVTGFILANSIFRGTDLTTEYHDMFEVVEFAALGLIGFKIGTELHVRELRSQFKTLFSLVLGNTGLALVLVTLVVFLVSGSQNPTQRLVLALILGGVATATAPAATVEIIRKYKAKGTLTTLVLAVLALNDLFAIVFIEIVLVIIRGTFTSAFSVQQFFGGLFQEIGMAILLGVFIGVVLNFVVERMHDELEMMELTLGVLIFAIGVAHYLHTSVILTTMIIGITVTNLKGDNYTKAGDLLEVIMSPVVTLFFVLVGAKITFDDFNPFPFLVLIYFFTRLIGKYFGSYFGAKVIGQPEAVTKNLGFTMFAQGGVALGLATLIGETLIEVGENELATLVVSVIIIGTVFSETLGTLTARYGLGRAGEIGAESEYTEDELVDPYAKKMISESSRQVHPHD